MAESHVKSLAVVHQFSAAISAALAGMSAGCWSGWPSPSIPNLIKGDAYLTMGSEEISWMVAVMQIGIVVSPLPTASVMDRFGRKKVIICTGIMFVSSWVLTAVAYNAWFLYAARLVGGLASGMCSTVLPVYLCEIASVNLRGALTTMMNFFMWIGITLEFVVGIFVSFELLSVLSAIPALLLLLTFPFMPESPYFLSMKGRQEDALEALMWLRNSSAKNSEIYLDAVKTCIEEDKNNKRHFSDFISDTGIRRGLLIILGLGVFQKIVGFFSVVAYASTTLPPGQGVFGPSEVMIVFAAINVLVNLLCSQIVDRWGRRPLLLISAAGTSVSRALSALYFFLDRETSVNMDSVVWVSYASILLSAMVEPGLGSIPYTLAGELLPTNAKSHTAAISTILSAATAFLVDKLYVTVDIHLGVYVDYLFFSATSVLCYIFIFVLVFETKGKSFTEIQNVLKSNLKRSLDSL